MDSITLQRAIQTLARISRAGLLDEFRIDVAEACRGPADDLDRHADVRWAIYRSSRIASQLFGVSTREAERAAKAALLPTTREAIVLRLLAEYESRLDADAAQQAARQSVRAFNRRAAV